MVDLAGSETVKKTGAEGQTLKEAQVCLIEFWFSLGCKVESVGFRQRGGLAGAGLLI